jgi:uncharacterized protein involved in exopolysaccharide biosynthesis/Mrp family chromosome partitioning ATPase
MNAKNTRPHAPLITLADIYYILFRHKWKIIVLAVLGIAAAVLLPLAWPQTYISEAKLLIKYVADTHVPTGPNSDGSRTLYTDAAGRNIINTELQILTSLDLAQEVATNVGPDKILGRTGDFHDAGNMIKNNLLVEPMLNSDVIRITFQHRNPKIAQLVLNQIITTYLADHARIHRPGGADDILRTEAEEMGTQLKMTEDALTTWRTNLQVTSFEDAQRTYAEQLRKIEDQMFDAEAELAAHQAAYAELSKQSKAAGDRYGSSSDSNALTVVSGTNGASTAAGTNAVAHVADTNSAKTVSLETVDEYNRIRERIISLHAEENELLKTFLPENSRVKEKRAQIAGAEKQKKQLEQDNPGLLVTAVMVSAASGGNGSSPADRLADESTQIAGLQGRLQVLTNQLAYVQGRAAMLNANLGNINTLQRTKSIEADALIYLQKSGLTAGIEGSSGAKSSNISIIQKPSDPYTEIGKLQKARIGLALAGILLGLGMAFLIEMYIDRTVKRPADIEAKLGVPLFLSIPYLNGRSHRRLLTAPPKTSLVLRSDADHRTVALNGTKTTIGRSTNNTVPIDDSSISENHCEIFSRNGDIIVKDLGSATGTFVDDQRIVEATLKPEQSLRVGNVEFRVEVQENKAVAVSKKSSATPPWDPQHPLRPFYDTLRDRLITYFEVKNLTHNPKLVALTSCGDRSGVTSTAAGLAAALSETGEGNVLLVDMNVEQGAAHHFYKGHLSCGISEALTKDKRDGARVQDHLYVVTESGSDEDSLPRALPKRFTNLVPELKKSDFDYIIFDMPPMSQISITPRLARFMDMVMVVVESEKTDREVVQRAVNMLTDARANVGVVLNKRKKYVPERIQQEL